MVVSRKYRYSVVSVAIEYSCGFLPVQVVPIPACSLDKLRTSKNGTTYTEEIPTTIF
ncbi:hypothetical protein [Clostridium beijerinckii]|uniref:hypothetical protein n=1 Tax=Clostridium beijerinckii TaxID=1520 RepID=UPI001361A4F0|nr:hypothetical protein [Clostridium beijerinckii]MZK51519.1 hypothetical protein [Clostridium beijerinckii]MZK59794.1 hypothetical protein [Clostridium beijerinckii]MZK70011.1 hypothetical protein [Clostridium beijerinckii]MZK75313.1 hypothetical protein [Clostridium beijerinckii]MZK84929.1 hypothetical protein [Clostridium beijerinckii]